MNIKNLDKADVLVVLYNNARSQGLSLLQYDSGPMTREQAQKIIASGQTYFDYVKGRVMKIDIGKDEVDTFLYNRDNGPNAAETAIQELVSSFESKKQKR